MMQQKGLVALVVTALAAIALAGCAADEETQDTNAPTASLTVEQDDHWSPATVTFDAQGSADPNGQIAEFRFDFGDGQTMTVTDEEQARVQHTYDRGGAFNVTVQVLDDGEGQDKILTDSTSVTVYVDQRYDLAVQPATAGPLANQTNTAAWSFAVYDGAQRYQANLSVENTAVVGSSQVTVQVLDPEGAVIVEDQVTVPEGESRAVNLTGLLSLDGDHAVRVVADSGSVRAAGAIDVHYRI